jgi:O-antigen/teichoic acid export membrane protein
MVQRSIFKNEIVRRIGINATWSLSGEVIGRGASVLAGFLAARILEVNGFGQLGMIRSTIGTFSVFAGLGLGVTATCYIAKYKHSDPQTAGEILGLCRVIALVLGTVIAFALFLSAPFLSRTSLADPSLSSAVRIAAAMVFLSSMLGVEFGALSGFEGFRFLAFASGIEGITTLIATVPLAYFFGVNGAVSALVFSQFIKLIVLRKLVTSRCHEAGITISVKAFKKHLSVLWNYSIPAFLCGFMYGPAIWILNQIVVAQPNGYQMLGIMSAADQWRSLILVAPGALGTVIIPVLANLRGTHQTTYKKTVLLNFGGQFFIAFCAAIPIAIFSSLIASLYGPSFTGLTPIIAISCAIAIFHALGNAAGNALMTATSIWPNFLLNLLWAVCLIISGYFLVRLLGVAGLAISYLVAHFIQALIMLNFVLRSHRE